MKKFILLCGALLLLSFCILHGTETRTAALGAEHNLLIDDANIYAYPSGMVRFIERSIIEYGFYPYSDSIAYLGLYKEIGKFGNLGIVANRADAPLFPSTSAQTATAHPDGILHLLYAITVKDAVSIGISGGYGIAAMNDDEQGTANDVTNESSVTSGKISITYVFGASDHFVELGGGIHTYSFDLQQGDNFSFENNNDMSTSFSGRLFFNLNDFASIIPYAAYQAIDLSSKETVAGSSTEITRLQTNTKVGVGFNLAPFEEHRVILGVAYKQSVTKIDEPGFDSTVTQRLLPEFFGGIESQIRPWLVARVGMAKSLSEHTTEIANGIQSTLTQKGSPFDLQVGCGLRFGPLSFDGVLQEDFRYTGGYLLSGQENPIFTRVSATYHF